MKDAQKMINRKKALKKIKPNVSYAGMLEVSKVTCLVLITVKLYWQWLVEHVGYFQ